MGSELPIPDPHPGAGVSVRVEAGAPEVLARLLRFEREVASASWVLPHPVQGATGIPGLARSLGAATLAGLAGLLMGWGAVMASGAAAVVAAVGLATARPTGPGNAPGEPTGTERRARDGSPRSQLEAAVFRDRPALMMELVQAVSPWLDPGFPLRVHLAPLRAEAGLEARLPGGRVLSLAFRIEPLPTVWKDGGERVADGIRVGLRPAPVGDPDLPESPRLACRLERPEGEIRLIGRGRCLELGREAEDGMRSGDALALLGALGLGTAPPV